MILESIGSCARVVLILCFIPTGSRQLLTGQINDLIRLQHQLLLLSTSESLQTLLLHLTERRASQLLSLRPITLLLSDLTQHRLLQRLVLLWYKTG